MIEFGITLRPDPPPERIVELICMAEAQHFSYGWLFDSHVLWMDPYPLLVLMAVNTASLRLGTCVTNPGTRDPSITASSFATLQAISGGRMIMGIGRGDSALRVMGKQPVSLTVMENAIQEIRTLVSGEATHLNEQAIQLKWARSRLPIFVAAYGPKALRLAGRVGDGVVLQCADPHLIKWSLNFVREGCEEAGRDWSQFHIMCATAGYVSDDLEYARSQVRWFPALVSNHVIELLSRYPATDLPAELTSYVRQRSSYDYQKHCQVGASHAEFVTDEVVDRFCVIGTADQCRQRIRELAVIGVNEFNLYLMAEEQERLLEIYGREIIPEFCNVQVRPRT
ncbi:LLM class F420-dependent oxidoreductase [Ktedonobacter sp. SOSP1-85]|uniref:TIGR03842 family LLM class F420-dependent oxidoreductase n=1 Tax=Ktedonobacter sp. SOSP1-85 TaxID=2778367 RepID=UPI00191624C1|nr:TIGR03842 family LLM class F420-dependent oxidoreductase [Ktedonobacter sp. SOSP1-85]GHO79893.1 LLM class F420-dependent oxidoreductase [Ktedonobacter sp. SOSP1-85]